MAERAEDRALYNKQHGIDPNKPRQKRKRGVAGGTSGQGAGGTGAGGGRRFGNVSDAIASFAQEKKFSSRINYGMLKNFGIDSMGTAGLERMDDDKMEDEKDDYKGDGGSGLRPSGPFADFVLKITPDTRTWRARQTTTKTMADGTFRLGLPASYAQTRLL